MSKWNISPLLMRHGTIYIRWIKYMLIYIKLIIYIKWGVENGRKDINRG